MKQITPCLWFKDRALEAAKFYCAIFPKSKVGTVLRYGKSASKASGQPVGSVLTVSFTLNGQSYLGLNGGSVFKFSPAFSLIVPCKSQREIDYYWKRLISGGGRSSMCGWLVDKFGFSWQIVHADMDSWWRKGSAAANERVMAEVMTMRKLDYQRL